MILKNREDFITETLLTSMVGKFIHAPINNHEFTNNKGENETVNVWFAGLVVGYDTAVIYYDFENNSFLDSPEVKYSLLLSDGMAYSLSLDSEIVELTEEEFSDMVEKFAKEQMAKESIILPEGDTNIVRLDERR